MIAELGAVALALTLTGLWSYLMARAGVWAAVRHMAASHDPSADVCIHCLRRELEKHR